jgi:Ca2+-binding RTX toxin-like protein
MLNELDNRSLPSVSLVGGVLTVGGTAGADAITVWRPTADAIQVNVSSTGEVRRFSLSKVNEIEVRSGMGDDLITVGNGLTLAASLFGGRGHDTILAGGGDDNLHGGRGADALRGRGGNDNLFGDDGDDDIRGGIGDDSLDGGNGRDDCNGGDGTDDVINGMNAETELTASLSGTGSGSASFGFNLDPSEIEREFEVEAEGQTPGAGANVLVDGVSVGTMTIDATGHGKLKFKLNFDSDHDGFMEFPGNFPEIHSGSTIAVQVNGSTVLSGAFA